MIHLKEIVSHAIDGMNDKVQELQYKDDLHNLLFNEDYFIIGYFQASEFLKQIDVDAFEAIGYVIEQENEQFGESNLKGDDINSEKIVNLFAYFKGQELIYSLDSFESANDRLTNEDIKAIVDELEELIKE